MLVNKGWDLGKKRKGKNSSYFAGNFDNLNENFKIRDKF